MTSDTLCEPIDTNRIRVYNYEQLLSFFKMYMYTTK